LQNNQILISLAVLYAMVLVVRKGSNAKCNKRWYKKKKIIVKWF